MNEVMAHVKYTDETTLREVLGFVPTWDYHTHEYRDRHPCEIGHLRVEEMHLRFFADVEAETKKTFKITNLT